MALGACFILAILAILSSAAGLFGVFVSLPMAEHKFYVPVMFSTATAALASAVVIMLFAPSPVLFLPLGMGVALYVPFLATLIYNAATAARQSIAESRVKIEPYHDAINAQARHDYRRAIGLYENYLQSHPRDAGALANYADCLDAVGRKKEWLAALARVAHEEKGARQLDRALQVIRETRALAGDAAAEAELARWREFYLNTPMEAEFEKRL